jgi:hypothetical protein
VRLLGRLQRLTLNLRESGGNWDYWSVWKICLIRGYDILLWRECRDYMAGAMPRNILHISRELNYVGLWARLKEDVVRLWTATQDGHLIAVPDRRSE